MSMRIDVNTRLVGLLGYPLGHSLSPAMHNSAFRKLGLNYLYLPIQVTDADLKDVTTGIAKMNFAGYNITIPHKVRIMEYLDRVDELARIIGAVNTVSLKDGVATGCNTDAAGFLRALEAEAGISVEGKRFFIIGSGGAARAIVMALACNQAKEIFISNRTERKALDLAAEVNTKVRHCGTALPDDRHRIKDAMLDTDILVNTTSVGMHPHIDRMPIAEELLRPGLIVADIVYNPLRTRLLQAAEKMGCKTVGGLGMLVYQGAEGFKIWTGLEAPIEVMFEAVRSARQV